VAETETASAEGLIHSFNRDVMPLTRLEASLGTCWQSSLIGNQWPGQGGGCGECARVHWLRRNSQAELKWERLQRACTKHSTRRPCLRNGQVGELHRQRAAAAAAAAELAGAGAREAGREHHGEGKALGVGLRHPPHARAAGSLTHTRPPSALSLYRFSVGPSLVTIAFVNLAC